MMSTSKLEFGIKVDPLRYGSGSKATMHISLTCGVLAKFNSFTFAFSPIDLPAILDYISSSNIYDSEVLCTFKRSPIVDILTVDG